MHLQMDYPSCQRRWSALFVLLSVLAFATGCAQLDLTAPHMPWQEDEDELESPRKLVAFWSDTVLHQQGKPAVRGFGGRIFFYGVDDAEPLEVDGAVIVYAFNADRHDPATQKPEKKFVFKAEQLTDHFSQSRMGPSYSFWLPWDGVRGPTRNISLVVRYEGKDGTVVIADPVAKLLPGSNQAVAGPMSQERSSIEQARTGRPTAQQEHAVQQAGLDGANRSPVRHVDYQEPMPSHRQRGPDSASDLKPVDLKPARSITVESIDLPPSFVRRLRRNAAAEVNTNAASANSTTVRQSPSLTLGSSSPMPAGASGDRDVSAENRLLGAIEDPQPSRYGSRRFPARTRESPMQGRGLLRRGPHLAGWQSGLPPTPRSGWNRTTGKIEPAYPMRSSR